MLNLCFGKSEKENEDYKIFENLKPTTFVNYAEIDPKRQISFKINGKQYNVTPCDDIPITMSLNTYIRLHAKLTGTKFFCLEGGCGLCIVSLRGINPVSKKFSTWSVNSCLWRLFSCDGLEVITIEDLGNKKNGYGDLQKRLADYNGSQCGFCSPGQIMSMHSLLESKNGTVTKEEVENGLSGNICRCTGYRPILDAFKSFAVDKEDDVDDIEDLLSKVCPKSGQECKGKCRKAPIHLAAADGKMWYKVSTIQEILEILNGLDASVEYILIHGNTSRGLYPNHPNYKIYIDVTGVDELHYFKIGSQVELGGCVSIFDCMNVIEQAANQSSNFNYLRQVRNHLSLVANNAVRNVGSLAGNLSLKHQHNEFPSDIFLLFETIGAKLEIIDLKGGKQTVRPSEFLKLNMNRKVISKIFLPSLNSGQYMFESYKIMGRAQNVTAYVNAAFSLKIDCNNIVKQASIVFGGINSTFIHASKAENYLIGKNLFKPITMSELVKTLENEINPDWVLPNASDKYRKMLAISLFYKFVLSISPASKIKPQYLSGGETLFRPLSSGTQSYQTNPEKYPLTEYIPKIEGVLQTSGTAEYVNDIPVRPFELWAAFVVARNVGMNVVGFNTDKAFELPGVRHFISAKDIPGENNFMIVGLFTVVQKEEIFCSGTVLFNGQPVGLILADSFEIANEAAELVEVQYRQMSKQSSKLFKKEKLMHVKEPKVEMANVGVTQIIKGRFEAGEQCHFSTETQACIVVPKDGGYDVFSSTQDQTLAQTAISLCLNVPMSSVNVEVTRQGGAFGSKLTRSAHIACAAAVGAYVSNSPVRLILTLTRTLESIGKRIPFTSDYEIEFDENGKILKALNDYKGYYGCSENDNVFFLLMPTIANCYYSYPIGITASVVVTDSIHNVFCRAPGTLDAIAMIENSIEHIAKVLKKDPVDVRFENIPNENPMKQILKDFLESTDYKNRQNEIEAFNKSNRWHKKGIACVPMQWPTGYFFTYHAIVSIFQGDGTVAITHGGTECGQGVNTKAAQVAAYTLGISIDKIRIKPVRSVTSPNDFATGGSITSNAICYAVIDACKILMERLKPFLAKRADGTTPTWIEAVQAAYFANINLQGVGFFNGNDYAPYLIFGVAVAEVEVDCLTGNYIFQRVDILEDVGDSISPGVDIGQVEGAFVMGMGYWLTEKLVYDNTTGKLLTNRAANYLVPQCKDIPVQLNVSFLKSRPSPGGAFGSKAVGEPATCMSVVCLFALRNALNSARMDAGLPDEYFEFDLPATPENVFIASGTDLSQLLLN